MKNHKVFVIGNEYAYVRMFIENEYEVVFDITDADIVVFTGGSDVDPALYNRDAHPTTFFSTKRDEAEKGVYELALKENKFMVGICRGAQFLCVMNGHELYQHVNNHAGKHEAIDIETNRVIEVTSTHHQMMKLNTFGNEPILVTAARLSTRKEFVDSDGEILDEGMNGDIECLYFEDTKSLCFQPHPEFVRGECQDYFFNILERFLK